MVRFSNGFYSFSDSHFKAMRKQDLINYIRTIEKNWENQLITNDIQYSNCKKLLAEERNKAIDEFAERLKTDYVNFDLYYILQNNNFAFENTSLKSYQDMVEEIAKQMKGGE